MLDSFILFLTENRIYFPILLFIFLALRFFIISTGMYYLLWVRFKSQLEPRKIQEGSPVKGQIKTEIRHSLISFFAMSVVTTPLFFLFTEGKTAIYRNWSDYPLWMIPVGVLIFFFWHDWTFYISHRWLHTPWAFRRYHYIHHTSKIPTPFASHSFHWVEGVIQILFIYPIVMFVPMHPWTFVIFMAISHFFATWGHLNYELMPFKAWNSWWGAWVTTSTHHNYHHKFNNGNLALYLRRWDRKNDSLHPKTGEKFDEYLKK